MKNKTISKYENPSVVIDGPKLKQAIEKAYEQEFAFIDEKNVAYVPEKTTLNIMECYNNSEHNTNEINKILAHILKLRRHDLNYTLKQCERAGISSSYWNKAENNKTTVSRAVLSKMCGYFQLSLDKLMNFATNVTLDHIIYDFMSGNIKHLKELCSNDFYQELTSFNTMAIEALISIAEERYDDTINYLNNFTLLQKSLENAEWFVFFYIKALYDYKLEIYDDIKDEILIMEKLAGSSDTFKVAGFALSCLISFRLGHDMAFMYYYNQFKSQGYIFVDPYVRNIIEINHNFLMNKERHGLDLEMYLLNGLERNSDLCNYAISLLVHYYFSEKNYDLLYQIILKYHLENNPTYKTILVFLGFSGFLKAVPEAKNLVKEQHTNGNSLRELYYYIMNKMLNQNVKGIDILKRYEIEINKLMNNNHDPYLNEIIMATMFKIYRDEPRYKQALEIYYEAFHKGYHLINFEK